MISQTAEYALRAMVVLLACRDSEYCSSHDVAGRARVPVDYMSKILNALVKAGLVIAQRGRHGGCKAARTGAEISVLDVVQAVDPIPRIRTCPVGIASHGVKLCPLHRKLDQAAQAVEEAFGTTSLADLLSDAENPSIPLCAHSKYTHVRTAGCLV